MDIDNIPHFFYRFLDDFGWSETLIKWLNLAINLALLLVIAYGINKFLQRLFKVFLGRFAKRTTTEFDDYLYKNRVYKHLAHLLVLIFIRGLMSWVLIDFNSFLDEVYGLIDILIVVVVLMLIRSILLTVKDYLKTLPAFRDKPIESYIQVFMIFSWLFAIILIFSILTGKELWQFLTAMGAVSAIVLLIFKDTILGFVASIQVSVNDTVRIGDWITMSKYGADGDVIEINLSSVKVRNFDKTITSIPTYYLVQDSFINWRGMSVSGGRRIKRALIIKTSSIGFLSEEKVESLKKIELISDYLDQRQKAINKSNHENKTDKSLLLNGRNLTNLGVFRKYVDNYLDNHYGTNKEMIMMSRQLDPTPQGIPLEIYAFSNDKVWKNYENIQSDIFDHLLAALPSFGLEIFELPTGKDLKEAQAPFNSPEGGEAPSNFPKREE